MKKNILTIALLFILIPFLFSEEIKKNEFKHNVLGFIIEYPADWNIMSVDEYYKNLSRTKLNDEEFNKMLVKNAQVPFFAITKYKEPYNDLNPSIKINTRPYGNLKEQKLDVILKSIMVQFEKLFKDYKIVQDMTEIKIGDIPALYFKINYTLVTQDGTEYPACSELWLIDKTDYFYMIGVGTKQNEKKEIMDEIKSVIESIKIKM